MLYPCSMHAPNAHPHLLAPSTSPTHPTHAFAPKEHGCMHSFAVAAVEGVCVAPLRVQTLRQWTTRFSHRRRRPRATSLEAASSGRGSALGCDRWLHSRPASAQAAIGRMGWQRGRHDDAGDGDSSVTSATTSLLPPPAPCPLKLLDLLTTSFRPLPGDAARTRARAGI